MIDTTGNRTCQLSITWMGSGDPKLYIANGNQVLFVCKYDSLRDRLARLHSEAWWEKHGEMCILTTEVFEVEFQKFIQPLVLKEGQVVAHENVLGVFQLKDILSYCPLTMTLEELEVDFGPNLAPYLRGVFAQQLSQLPTGTDG